MQVQNIYSAKMYTKIYNMYNKSDGYNIIKHSLCTIIYRDFNIAKISISMSIGIQQSP